MLHALTPDGGLRSIMAAEAHQLPPYASRSGRALRESSDARDDLPKEGPCQGAFGGVHACGRVPLALRQRDVTLDVRQSHRIAPRIARVSSPAIVAEAVAATHQDATTMTTAIPTNPSPM